MMSDSEVTGKLRRVQSLISAGQYSEAGMILQAMSGLKQKYPMISQLTIKLNTQEALNTRLQQQLGRQVAEGNWRAVRATLRRIASLHPLSVEQQRLMHQAQSALVTHPDTPTAPSRPSVRKQTAGGGSTSNQSRPPSGPVPNTSSGKAGPPPKTSSPGGKMPEPPPSIGSGTPGPVF